MEITETIDQRFDNPEKATALAQSINVRWTEIEQGYDGDHFDANGAEYWVMDDLEADRAWDESLDNYIDECILPELPEFAQMYFDSDSWKRDAKFDGRGHSLNYYDGSEEEERVNGTYYFIYRTN